MIEQALVSTGDTVLLIFFLLIECVALLGFLSWLVLPYCRRNRITATVHSVALTAFQRLQEKSAKCWCDEIAALAV